MSDQCSLVNNRDIPLFDGSKSTCWNPFLNPSEAIDSIKKNPAKKFETNFLKDA